MSFPSTFSFLGTTPAALVQTGGWLMMYYKNKPIRQLPKVAENMSWCTVHISNENLNLSQGLLCNEYPDNPPSSTFDVWTIAGEAQIKTMCLWYMSLSTYSKVQSHC